jgi:uncharacterized protein (TIRG00374 family)
MTTKPGALGNSSSRQTGFAIVKVLISIALLYTLFQAYDIEAALKRLAGVDLRAFLIPAALVVVGMVLTAWRWRIIVGALGGKILAKTAFFLVWIGMFFNQALPSNLGGDAMRIWMFYRHGGVLKRAVGSVFLDCVAALVGLAIVVALTFPLAAQFIDDMTVLVILAFLVAAIFIGLLAFLWLDRFMVLFARLLPLRFYQSITSFVKDTRIVLASRQYGPYILGLSIANQVSGCWSCLRLHRASRLMLKFRHCWFWCRR